MIVVAFVRYKDEAPELTPGRFRFERARAIYG